ncbi:Gamma-aminobutyric acid type B receptor subunit 1 [Caenorhabditis elegans]|uniref:Isoform a of Gamma-aminobutyric acid type B receptor subunit 1 n=1 Tax=Caenorhabditis elegans TaxID=6239 RepID=H2L0Q3-2|nr:Gamma-aminobutyric acid type B receptor subunit 1 [Caenorhabditis elegans]CCD74420.2 Gamma-aminobutyric acid type B receptor subunit 1 [Caenorhabditis elegans]|eukprot:NP_741741.2 Gamma-aminobutyric acid type B receptor subunit 1 [Caenorhabditis elegans]
MFVRSSWLLLWGTIVWASAEPVTLHIGGTFPMESGSGGWAGGEACLPAVEMALKDVNSRLDILPGYVLNMTNHNSQCQPGLAMQQLYDFLYKPPTKLMLLTGCSPVTTVIAEAAPVWKLVVLSYGGSSPALSNRNRFPTLFRTHPSANMQNPTRIHIMEKFKWKRFTILMSVEEVFVTTAKDLEAIARKKGIKVDRQSFYGDPTDAMKTLQRQDARIIVGLFYVTEARKVLCQAYHHGLYGRRYVWFFIGWYADTWYIPPPEEHLNCTAEQMTEAAEYHFTTESVMLSRDNIPAISEMTGMQFQQRLTQYFQKDTANVGGFPEAPLAYDAVWALALAFNCTRNNLPSHIRLENFTYDNKVIADTLFQCVKNTSFRGVSGKVMFSDSGDRIARTQIEQMQGGKYKIMGYYDTTSGDLEWYNKEQWLNGKGPPPDSTVIKKHAMTVSNEFYYPTILFAVLGIAACVFIYLFTQKHHERLIIFQSQPECNNILLIGCSLCLFSLFLIGLPSDDISISESLFPLLCHVSQTFR